MLCCAVQVLLLSLLDLPFSISPVVTGLMLMLLYGRSGWFAQVLAENGFNIVFAFPGACWPGTFRPLFECPCFVVAETASSCIASLAWARCMQGCATCICCCCAVGAAGILGSGGEGHDLIVVATHSRHYAQYVGTMLCCGEGRTLLACVSADLCACVKTRKPASRLGIHMQAYASVLSGGLPQSGAAKQPVTSCCQTSRLMFAVVCAIPSLPALPSSHPLTCAYHLCHSCLSCLSLHPLCANANV